MTGKIALSGMRFKAFHGCLESEKINGNEFMVDFECRYDISKAAVNDKLEETLDYSAIYETVKREMQKRSRLLENVAARIAGSIAEEFPQIICFSVKVNKKNPPVGGEVQWSSVTIEYPDEQ